MQRRSFVGGLASILAAGFAPAAVGSGILMPVKKIQRIQAHSIWTRKPDGTVSVLRNSTDGAHFTGIDTRYLKILDSKGNVIFSATYDGKMGAYRGDYIDTIQAKTKDTRWVEYRN